MEVGISSSKESAGHNTGYIASSGSLIRTSRLAQHKQDKLIELFVAGSTARTAAALADVNKTTAAFYFHRIRQLIHKKTNLLGTNNIEINTKYISDFLRKKNVSIDTQDLLAFAIIKEKQNFSTKMIIFSDKPSVNDDEINLPESLVFFNSTKKSDFVDISKLKQCRLNTSEDKSKHRNINEIENFWSQTKRQLRKYNGIPKAKFELFLRECQWRYNTKNPKNQLDIIKEWASGNL